MFSIFLDKQLDGNAVCADVVLVESPDSAWLLCMGKKQFCIRALAICWRR